MSCLIRKFFDLSNLDCSGRYNRIARLPQALGRLLLLTFLLAVLTSQPSAAHHAEPVLQGPFRDSFIVSHPRKPAPSTSFTQLDGTNSKLGTLRGKTVLLNFWATWCAPCVREMPALDRLQARLKDEGLVVLAISSDRGGAQTVLPFLLRHGLKEMQIGLDPRGALGQDFVIPGLPTTYLIDPEGQIIGAMAGPAEWDGPDALALVESMLPHRAGADDEIINSAADCGCHLGAIMAKKKAYDLKKKKEEQEAAVEASAVEASKAQDLEETVTD